MKKILVIGAPGAGKSTFSRKLQELTGLPLYYLDMLYHKPDKTTLTEEEFNKRLYVILQKDNWIIDGNYLRSLKERIKYCDTIFFLDYPIEICLDGVRKRVGIKRDDMPWIEEELDNDFYEYVRNFPNYQLPKMYEILNEYKGNLIIFKRREIADNYLKEFKKN